jgi:hypothetical protein
MSKNHFLFLILIIFVFPTLQAQTYSPQQIKLAEKFDSLANNAPRESAYIQTSKDIYETGEDIWFKVYLLNSSTLKPSELSKTLYMQVVNEDTKKIIWQEKYEIENGFSNGRILLKEDLDEGNYLLEAFTSNSFFADSSDFTAIRKVKVVKDITHFGQINTKLIKQDSILPVALKKNPIQFNVFPEGGTIISGIKSKVAFKAVQINGEPINVTGILYKNDSVELGFSSTHDGMGSFDFMPVKNAKYYIKLKESLIDSIYSFPKIEPVGLTFRLLSRDKENVNFLISKNTGGQLENIYLMVQMRGIIYSLTEAKLEKNLKIKVPLVEMPQGIAEATLFNNEMIPVAERLLYVNPHKKIKIQTILSDSIFLTRGKVKIKFIARNENNNPVRANLALAVFDKLYKNQSDSINILTHFYLSTQLKGRIYNPGYYFNEKNVNRLSALDLLLLTQGWRKYIWNEDNLLGCANNEVVSDGIRGTATLAFGRKRVPKGEVNIIAFSTEKDSVKKVITVDSAGFFSINHNILRNFKGKYIYLKPIASTNASIKLQFINPFDSINPALISKIISTPLCSQFKEMKISESNITRGGAIHIKDVVIKGTKKDIIRGKFLGTLDSIAQFTLDVNTDVVGICGGLNCPICKRNGNTHPATEGESILDPDHGKERITYHRKPSKVNLTEEELLRLNNLFKIKAYFSKHEFYQPNYDKEYIPISVPDYRNTLMWNPSIITNEKGEATVSFYCSDLNTEFVGKIEGVGGDGLLCTDSFKIKVRKLKLYP